MFGVATHATHRGSVGVGESGRGGGIRTHDLLNPIQGRTVRGVSISDLLAGRSTTPCDRQTRSSDEVAGARLAFVRWLSGALTWPVD